LSTQVALERPATLRTTTSRVSPQQAAAEILNRRKARTNLLDYCRYVTPWYQTPRHIQYIAPFFEALESGTIDRLMWLTAPRHSKTETGLRFLSYYLNRNPTDQLILASYNARIAGQFGGKVRNILSSPANRRLDNRKEIDALVEEGRDPDSLPDRFGVALRSDSKAKDLFHTDEDGVFLAAGLAGGTTGFGGHGLYIDDFLKGRKEADSEVIREDIENHYSTELYTRLMPRDDGRPPWVSMSYTTWHESDLGQRELQAMLDGTGDKWWVVRMPALAEDFDLLGREVGEALWPERYDEDRLHRIKSVLDRVNLRNWPALFQGRPTTPEGTYFKRDMLRAFPAEMPPRFRKFMTTDWGTGGDNTVHMLWGIDGHSDAFVLDVYAEAVDTGVGGDAALDMIQTAGGVHAWIFAKGPIDKAVMPGLRSQMAERNIHANIVQYAETVDKETKALTMQARMASGRVFFDKRKPWYSRLEDEFLAFPAGKHDDRVDALAMLGLHYDKVLAPPIGPQSGVAVDDASPW
jgi:predicted phage terminase large subunit-like protein